MARLALYWHNGRSLGHTSESAVLARELLELDPSVSIAGISGAYAGLDAFPAAVDQIRLPTFRRFDRSGPGNLVPTLALSRAELFDLRRDLITTFLRHYRPDVLVVNHVPVGLEDELLEGLEGGHHSTAVLTLRGILFDPPQTMTEYFGPEASARIARHFDELHIHTDPDLFRLEDLYEVPAVLAERVRYTGYLPPPVGRSKEEARRITGAEPGERLLVVSMGGGQGAGDIYRGLAEVLRDTRLGIDRARFVTGPYLEEVEHETLAAAVSDVSMPVEVVRYDPDLVAWMQAADVFVGAGGANMLGEILASGANAVVIARQRRESEQARHIELLERRGLVRSMDRDDVVAYAADVLLAAFEDPADPAAVPVRLNGARASAAAILDLAGR